MKRCRTIPFEEQSETRFQSHFERFSDFPQETRTGGSNRISVIQVAQPGHQKIVPSVPEIVIRLVQQGNILNSIVERGGKPAVLSGRKGSVCVAPAHAEATWRSDSRHKLLMVAIPEMHASRIFKDAGAAAANEDPIEHLYDEDIFDPALTQMMEALWSEATDTGPAATLMVEGRATALLGRLLTLRSNRTIVHSDGGVPPLDIERLRRVTEFIEDNIGSLMTIDDLAQVAGRSPFHFARCFRAATGSSPHRFVLQRRVELARQLLEGTGEPISEIAYRCGFSSQSHLSTAFRKQLGSTPLAYRKAFGD
ncbi:MAG: AraC family transcriptional regulator [Pseudomonadota bacterium]